MRKCDNCPTLVKDGEGKFWHTGWFLCDKCFKEWKEKINKLYGIEESKNTIKRFKELGDY